MKIILLDETLHSYLLFILGARCVSGNMTMEELETAAEVKRRLEGAKDIDFSNLGQADLEKIGPGGISMGFDPSKKPTLSEELEETDRVRAEAGGPLPVVGPESGHYVDSGHPDQPIFVPEDEQPHYHPS